MISDIDNATDAPLPYALTVSGGIVHYAILKYHRGRASAIQVICDNTATLFKLFRKLKQGQ